MSEGREATLSASMIVAGENDRQRFDEGELRALAEDIRHQGCLQRPIVRQTGPQRYQLIAGERRVRAMRDILKMGGIPVLIVDVDDDTAADMMLSENLSRVDLTPLEEARAFAKAIARGLSAVEVGRRHGVAPARITRRLLLLELDPSVAEGLDVAAPHLYPHYIWVTVLDPVHEPTSKSSLRHSSSCLQRPCVGLGHNLRLAYHKVGVTLL